MKVKSSLFSGLTIAAFWLAVPTHVQADAVSRLPDPTHHHHYANPDGKDQYMDQSEYMPGHHQPIYYNTDGRMFVLYPDNNVGTFGPYVLTEPIAAPPSQVAAWRTTSTGYAGAPGTPAWTSSSTTTTWTSQPAGQPAVLYVSPQQPQPTGRQVIVMPANSSSAPTIYTPSPASSQPAPRIYETAP